MLFISPPFGNYVNLSNTIPITGSFTLEPRKGLFLQIIKTLRYSFEHEGWVNKIGLRNKGLDWALKNIDEKKILSIAILQQDEVSKIIQKLPENRNIEINVSCPNTEKKMIQTGIGEFLNPKRKWCIIKISPNTTNEEIDHYYSMGFRQFHCCNTIPVKQGGLSGRKLIPYNEKKISYLKEKYPNCQIIAGGGIQSYDDLLHYKQLGVNNFSISTLLFHPIKFAKFYYDYRKYMC